MAHRLHFARPAGGFTLIELLVAMTILLAVLAMTSRMVFSLSRWRTELDARVEAHQGLQAAMHAIAQDVRLAGACLPTLGPFLPLAAVNNGTTDDLTIRIGVVSQQQFCTRTTLRANAARGTTSLLVQDVTGFAAGMRIAAVDNTNQNEILTIARVDVANRTLQTSTALGRDYNSPGGVYALTERRYRIDATGPEPVLTLTIDTQPPQPFVAGAESLDVRYVLTQGCPTCAVRDQPTAAEWSLVDELLVSASVRAPGLGGASRPFRASAVDVRMKPRNLNP